MACTTTSTTPPSNIDRLPLQVGTFDETWPRLRRSMDEIITQVNKLQHDPATVYGTSGSRSTSPPGILSLPTQTITGSPTWTPIVGEYPLVWNEISNILYIWDGAAWQGVPLGVTFGTVTSVTFTGDGTVLSSTPSSAVTTTGTLAATLNTQAANKVLAGPTSGVAATPTFRSLVVADLLGVSTISVLDVAGSVNIAGVLALKLDTAPSYTIAGGSGFVIANLGAGVVQISQRFLGGIYTWNSAVGNPYNAFFGIDDGVGPFSIATNEDGGMAVSRQTAAVDYTVTLGITAYTGRCVLRPIAGLGIHNGSPSFAVGDDGGITYAGLWTTLTSGDIFSGGLLTTKGTNNSHVLFDHYADVGNSTTTETDLYSDTIAASQLSANGQKLEAQYAVQFTTRALETLRVRIYFAGTVIFDTGALTLSISATGTAYVAIIRKNVNTVRYMVSLTTEGAALAAYTAASELGSIDLTTTNILKITGQAAGAGATSNDINASMGYVEFKGNAS